MYPTRGGYNYGEYENWKEKSLDSEDKRGIMTLEQMNGGLGVPKEYIGNFTDFQPLSFVEQDKEVLESLYNASHKNGFEHGAALIDCMVYEFTSDLKDKVVIPGYIRKMINIAPKKSVQLFHSHTNATPHSVTDFQWLLHENIDKICVIAYNGDAYSVSIGSGWIPDIKEFTEISEKIMDEVALGVRDIPGYDDWTLDERYYARVREQAYRIARHFKWTMGGGSLL